MNQGNYYNNTRDNSQKEKYRLIRYAVLGLSIFSIIISFILFFVPFASNEFTGEEMTPISILSFEGQSIVTLIAFIVLSVLLSISVLLFMLSIIRKSKTIEHCVSKAQTFILYNTSVCAIYFISGIIFATAMNIKNEGYTAGSSLLPLALSVVCAIAFSFVVRGVDKVKNTTKKSKIRSERIEFFVYATIISIIAIISCFSNIIKVDFIEPSMLKDFSINGYKVITSYSSGDESTQILAFFLIAILTVVISLTVMSVTSFISRSKGFYKIALIQTICGCISTLIIALFGQYYEIVQKINENMILGYLNGLIGSFAEISLVYKVNSDIIYMFIASIVIFLVILIRKPYTKGVLNDAVVRVDSVPGLGADSSLGNAIPISSANLLADPCPAFSEIDIKSQTFEQTIDQLEEYSFVNPSLPDLVQFVVNYARDSRLHLSYTPEDIATFIAGLGTTRLTILQGMSGTGKTSLPKIFSEAIFGRSDIIEVESSWRDKNELIGYYNEFSHIYTPKKFTQALYRAKLNPGQITFIVLDEMNLSRIEYYFSDFLSLMENEEDKREIKLLNHPLYKNIDGKYIQYNGLTDGHTIKIPNNVWFIGTANRDESTFEISDKVYDRAHTMNFNKRAPKITYYHEPIPQRYLSVEAFISIIEDAKKSVKFDIETSTIAREVEELLAPYNITFGNRVANQIETFVSIYASCFTASDSVIKDGLETILLSKVVSKLEYKSVENKSYLASEFKRIGLNRCSEFISKLHED